MEHRTAAAALNAQDRFTLESYMYPLRVFLSYARQDRAILDRVAAILERAGLNPVSDEGIRGGEDFGDAIKECIATSHVLMPLLTQNSQGRPWIHHEIGFAIGINVPVVPLAIGCLPGGMISSIQAVIVRDDLVDLRSKISKIDLETLTTRAASELGRLGITYEVADASEDRARLLAKLARSVRGHVRQNAIFSSFSLPDAHPEDDAWDGFEIKGEHHRSLLRMERRLLEECGREEKATKSRGHAEYRQSGYSLIIHPFVELVPVASREHRVRLHFLLKFLQLTQSSRLWVRVAICRAPFEGSFTSVGDWCRRARNSATLVRDRPP